MPLEDFQYELGGVTFGAGTVHKIENVDGLGLGAKRPRVFQNAGADGVKWGREYRDGLTLTFEGATTIPGDPAGCWNAVRALMAAWEQGADRKQPQTTANLTIRFPGSGELVVPGRPDIFRFATKQLVLGRAAFTATFDAAGPLPADTVV